MGHQEQSSFLIVEKKKKSQPFSAISHYSNVHTHMHTCPCMQKRPAFKGQGHLHAHYRSGLYHFVASKTLVFAKFYVEC
jgi:hypothetical protein